MKNKNCECLWNVGVGENVPAEGEVLGNGDLPHGQPPLLPHAFPDVDGHPEHVDVVLTRATASVSFPFLTDIRRLTVQVFHGNKQTFVEVVKNACKTSDNNCILSLLIYHAVLV
jgi:hypothetical protein